jgi:putative DNA primase/helicase
MSANFFDGEKQSGSDNGFSTEAPPTTQYVNGRDSSSEDKEESTDRATIQVKAGELHILATKGEAAIRAAGLPIYQRGHSLVQPIVHHDVPASNGRTTTAAGLAAAAWCKWNARQKTDVSCDPPDKVAAIILSRTGQWRMPRIAGVITTPTLRPDGSILSEPGYDAATRLYHAADPTLHLPAMAERPTRADAEQALDKLQDLQSGFPFVADVDRSVGLSGVISAVVRGALPVSPMHAYKAPTAGTGKSYLVDLTSVIATGRIAPAISLSAREDETEKRLVGLLLAGYPLISLDNVNGELGGDLLCQAIERSLIRLRPLGSSDIIEIENRCSILANGNNLRISGDATRRTLLANLDANVERPELRSFDFDPVAQVLADRGAYIAACLVIVRAYLVAGSPDRLPALASFAEWSGLVRSALCWLGCADPCLSVEAARRDDPELGELRELMGAWEHSLLIDQRYTTRAIAAAAEAKSFDADFGHATAECMHPELRDVVFRIAGERSDINSKKLGNWLAHFEGRIVSGMRLTRDIMTAHDNVAQWVVRRV